MKITIEKNQYDIDITFAKLRILIYDYRIDIFSFFNEEQTKSEMIEKLETILLVLSNYEIESNDDLLKYIINGQALIDVVECMTMYFPENNEKGSDVSKKYRLKTIYFNVSKLLSILNILIFGILVLFISLNF